MKTCSIAAIQLCATNDIDANLSDARKWIECAVEQGAKIIGLPENFSFLGAEREKLERVDEIHERSESFLLEVARDLGVVLVGGGYAVADGAGKAYNRAAMVGADGILAQYDKMHLFDVDLPDRTYRESVGTRAGDEVITWDGGELGVHGLTICYDLRFPELYRALAVDGAEILWVPAAFTVPTGKAHWELLLRARAIENTCYLVAPAQVGEHGSRRESYGHALIVDPWGEVLEDAGGVKPGVIVAQVCADRLAEVRGQIPSLRHRKL